MTILPRIVLLFSLLLAGCAAPPPDQAPSPLAGPIAPHLPLLAWQGNISAPDANEADTAEAICVQFYVYLGNAVARGLCGHVAALPVPLDPIFPELVARFAPFTYQGSPGQQEQLVFRGYGSLDSPAWQRAVLAWARAEAGKYIVGGRCDYYCRMALIWNLGEDEDQPGVCRALWVLNYGYASAGSFSCDGGEVLGSSGWLQTSEWEYIDGLLTTHAPLENSNNTFHGTGVQPLNEAELGELDAVARAIFARLQSEPQPVAAPNSPIRVPTPTPNAAAQQTAAAVMAVAQPVTTTFIAPDGQAQVEIVTYGCAWTGDEETHAYELLRLSTGAGSAWRQVDSQLINCGGLGAYGFAALCWSTDYRYFYYTKTREGTPDGAGDWIIPLYELEVSSGLVRERGVMASQLSALSERNMLLCASRLP